MKLSLKVVFLCVSTIYFLGTCKAMDTDNSVKIAVTDCALIDSISVLVKLQIQNNFKNESIIFVADSWIREGWSKSGTDIALMVDESSRYPFLQLFDDFQKGQGDVGRDYKFEDFKRFVLLKEDEVLNCQLILPLSISYLEKVGKILKMLIYLPYAKEREFLKYMTNEQKIVKDSSITIYFVAPEEYASFTGGGKSFADIFTCSAGVSGQYPVRFSK